MSLSPELEARVARGLDDIRHDVRYVIDIVEAASAKIERRKARELAKQQAKSSITYCNECGKLKGWNLTFRRDTLATCDLCGNYSPCSVVDSH